jgi:hypothetical protein
MFDLMRMKRLIPLIFLFIAFIISSPLHAQHSLGLDKRGKVKRIHFYAGDHIKIKLLSKEKIDGRIDAIYDSSFIISGRKIDLLDVDRVFSTRKGIRFLGGALIVSGAFFFSLDAINNILNYNARGYVISNSVWAPSAIAVGSGLILYYFSMRRTKVSGKGNFRIFDTTPIPITNENSNP